MTADNQAVSGTFVYDAFGTLTYSSGDPGLRNRYCGNWGYRDDGDTFASLSASAGLLHVGARYYDPTTGRFTTRDSILTEHPYVYCDGDPVNAVDPTGHRRSFKQWVSDQCTGISNFFTDLFTGRPPKKSKPPKKPTPGDFIADQVADTVIDLVTDGGKIAPATGAFDTIRLGKATLDAGKGVFWGYNDRLIPYFDPGGDWK